MNKIIILTIINIFTIFPCQAFNIKGKPYFIDRINSQYSPIYVFEDNQHRCITFEPNIKIVQTCIDINHKEILVFDYYKFAISTLLFQPNPDNILVLGVGGGVLPKTFAALTPNAHIDAVDIDKEIIHVAKKYFEFPETKNLKTIVADGKDFVNKSPINKYDIIILDVVNDTHLPEQMINVEFMQNLKNLLTNKGIIFINNIQNSTYKVQEAQIIDQVFHNHFSILTDGGKLTIANKLNCKPSVDPVAINQYFEKLKKIGIDENFLSLLPN